MSPAANCYGIIKIFEGCRLKAYLDVAGIPTIGYGSIMYPDGTKIQMGEEVTQERAELMLKWEVMLKTKAIIPLLVNVILTQNQFDSLVSLTFNIGIGAFKKSTLLKKIKINPEDTTIRDEFMKWNKARVNGVLTAVKGLTNRRQQETDLYFTP